MIQPLTLEEALSSELEELGLLKKSQFINVHTRIFSARRKSYMGWLSFLLNYSSMSYQLCNHLIQGVHSKFSELDPLIQLDQKAMQYMQNLLDTVFKSQSYALPITDEEANDLLVVAVLYARYPHLVNASLEAVPLIIKSRQRHRGQLLLHHLFLKYEVPAFLVQNLSSLSTRELQLLMELVDGKSIRSCQELPVSVSARDIVHFYDYSFQFSIEQYFIEQAYIQVRLFRACKDQYLVYHLIRSIPHYYHRILEITEDIKFWERVIRFFHWHDGKIDTVFSHYIDYFESKRDQDYLKIIDPKKSLKRVGYEINQWHFELKLEQRKAALLTWDHHPTTKDDILQVDEFSYHFKELTSSYELQLEGQLMHHCVAYFDQACSQGHCSIWSFRRLVENIWKHTLTIRISGPYLEEIAGKCNRIPTLQERKVIELWARSNNLKIAI